MMGELNFGGLPTSSTKLVRELHKLHSSLSIQLNPSRLGK